MEGLPRGQRVGQNYGLGVAEAGFFPGMVLFFTYWFPASQRARTGALFMMASPVAVIIGAPVSTAVLQMDRVLGFRGWQWLFLIEGVPSLILGVACLFLLTDRIQDAAFLSSQEKQRNIAGTFSAPPRPRADRPPTARAI